MGQQPTGCMQWLTRDPTSAKVEVKNEYLWPPHVHCSMHVPVLVGMYVHAFTCTIHTNIHKDFLICEPK